MTMSGAQSPASGHPVDAVALLRALLLCQLAEHADQAASAAHSDAAAQEARDALGRLDEGTYGICEQCARPIPYERLEAVPHARNCVRCTASPSTALV